jgi:hypothetical protein
VAAEKVVDLSAAGARLRRMPDYRTRQEAETLCLLDCRRHFRLRGPEYGAVPFGHQTQIVPQLFVALFDVVSNFAAFECREHWVGNPPKLAREMHADLKADKRQSNKCQGAQRNTDDNGK